MKIACISSTKNHGDVIEAFVRLNGKICDSFFFVDESTDNTREILGLLAKEGYDIHILQGADHSQPSSTKVHIWTVLKTANPDWIFLLDADEIIVAKDKSSLIEEMKGAPPRTSLAARRKIYVPTSLDYFESANPLSECFAPCKETGTPYEKAVISGGLIPAGNHSAYSPTEAGLVEHEARSYYLAHFPVRSPEQIVVKNLIAMHSLMSSRSDALKNESSPVLRAADLIRSRNYILTLEDIQKLAIDYACTEAQTPVPSAELELQDRLGLRTHLIYLNLGRINALAALDMEIERLSKEIRAIRRGFKFESLTFKAGSRAGIARVAGA